jgi:hypothetical protein
MLGRLAISAMVGAANFVVVYLIARIEPVVYGAVLGVINAAVIFVIIGILKD